MAWKTVDLVGTKDGSNTSFTIPFNYLANTVMLFHNNAPVYRVTTAPLTGQYKLDGSVVTMGTAPDSADTLQMRGFEI